MASPSPRIFSASRLPHRERSRCAARSASARICCACSSPSARSCEAWRAKSWRMRLNTDSETSSGRSMRLTRTSTSVRPSWPIDWPANFRMSPMNSARSAATTCWIVRFAMTPLRPSLTISARRAAPDLLVAAGREVVLRDVRDAPLHVEVDVAGSCPRWSGTAPPGSSRVSTRRSNLRTELMPGIMKCRPGS